MKKYHIPLRTVDMAGVIPAAVPVPTVANMKTEWGQAYLCAGRWNIELPDGHMARHSRLVWQKAHPDEVLLATDVIHHRNEAKHDDRALNLLKMTQTEHNQWHRLGLIVTSFINDAGVQVKKCRRCGTEMPLTEFAANGVSRTGTPSVRPQCRGCRAKMELERRHLRALMQAVA